MHTLRLRRQFTYGYPRHSTWKGLYPQAKLGLTDALALMRIVNNFVLFPNIKSVI